MSLHCQSPEPQDDIENLNSRKAVILSLEPQVRRRARHGGRVWCNGNIGSSHGPASGSIPGARKYCIFALGNNFTDSYLNTIGADLENRTIGLGKTVTLQLWQFTPERVVFEPDRAQCKQWLASSHHDAVQRRARLRRPEDIRRWQRMALHGTTIGGGNRAGPLITINLFLHFAGARSEFVAARRTSEGSASLGTSGLDPTCEKEVNVFAVHLPRCHNIEVLEPEARSQESRPHLLFVETSLMGYDVAMTIGILIRKYVRLDGVSEYVRHQERASGLQERG